MLISMTPIPATSEIYQPEQTFAEKVQERRRRKAAAWERRLQYQARYQARYRNEPLNEKVQRLAGMCWLEYDAIRQEVEAYLPLASPTPAELRSFREHIARLVNDHRKGEHGESLH